MKRLTNLADVWKIRYCGTYAGAPGSYGLHIAGIPVLLQVNNTTVRTAYTDGEGFFEFKDVTPGAYNR